MANVVISHNQEQCLDCKELVMQELVIRFGNGDFQHGFEKIELSTSVADTQNSQLEGMLRPAPAIPALYQTWQDKYRKLINTPVSKTSPTPRSIYTENMTRGSFKNLQATNLSYHECQQECHKSAKDLCQGFNQWLSEIRSQVATLPLDPNSEILLTINTKNITSQETKDILHRLPWQEWDYFNDSSAFETVLCLSESESNSPLIVDDGIFRRVRITSIFGVNEGINLTEDKKLIAKLQKQGAELINLEQPQRQDFIKLWDEPCDILFYSGHSESDINGSVGSLKINSQEWLNLEEVENTFREAVKKGLQIGIFNSCDGLGLMTVLANLHLPYIIVWRERVQDGIAQKFLEYFLSSYAEGKSLFTSMRDARLKLIELTVNADKEKAIPGLKWLPIICKGTSNPPPLWKDLGGLTGKLPDCPYQALFPFGEENKDFFFGRDSVIADLVEAVNSKPLVPVVGVSGSGKSSVVFAGLVPHLRDALNVQIVSFRPGKNPFDALAVALKNLGKNNLSHPDDLDYKEREEKYNFGRLKEMELGIDLQQDKQALCKFIQEIVKHPRENNPNNSSWNELKIDNSKVLRSRDYARNDNLTTNNIYSSERFVLIADQFEELYTLTEESQRQPFLDALLYAVQHAPAFTLVLTLRADFTGKVTDYQPMAEAFNKYPLMFLTPMKPEELQAAIEQPAAKLKIEFESGLVSKIIDDLGNKPGGLPLLQFNLSLLWEKPDKWYLTHKAYEEIGGLEKALAKHADGVLNRLSAADKQKAERIFIQLIRPGEGTEDTKRQATRGEVGEDNWQLVDYLVNNRLVVTGWDETTQQETVEIIHEALIREWGMSQRWIQSNRQFRTWQERLQFALVKWEHQKRSDEYLLSGGALGEAEGWLNDQKYREYLSNSQREFIRESLKKRDREEQEKVRLQRRAIKWLSGGLVAALLATGFAGWNWVKADISATQEKLNSLVAISENSLNLQNSGDALVESIKANELLRNTWLSELIPTGLKQKVEAVLHYAINDSVVEKNTLSGHRSNVYDVKFSPDGKTIASASPDKTVKLWSASDGKLLRTLSGHQGTVNSVKFSPDGKTIASASDDKTVKLWSTSDGKLLRTLAGHQGTVKSVKFSPDGKTIASASDDKTVKLWSASDGKLLYTLAGHQGTVKSVKFSPDGETIASTSDRDKTVKLWSVADGKLLHTLKGHQDEVNSAEFSPDGKTIASASWDKTVKLWSASDGKLLRTLAGHQEIVDSVKFSPDGKTIASASVDLTVKLWSTSDGTLLNTLEGHQNIVSSVEFSPDGKTIASASLDKTIKLWSVADGKLLYTLSGHQRIVKSAEFSPDGKTIASASSDKTVKLWSVADGKFPHTLRGHQDTVTSVKFSPDGKTIASASYDTTVKLWSASDGKLLYTLPGNQYVVASVKFSPDGKTIASVLYDETVKLWSVADGKLLHTLPGHQDEITSVEFSPDSKTIASVSKSKKKTVKLWSVADGKLLHTLSGHQYPVYSVKFSPDGKTIASASGDRTVKLWSVADGKLLHTLSGHQDLVDSVEFSPDSKTIASAASALWDKTVKLWSVADGKLLHTLAGHQEKVTSMKFSPDGKTIASASVDTTVKLWSTSDGKLLHTLLGHQHIVTSVKFNPDGKTIASASVDKTVKLWSTSDGTLLNTLEGHQDTVTSVEFNPDGKTIASASGDKTVKIWDWNFDNLLTKGCNKLQSYLIERPEKLEELKVCQNPEILTPAASSLVREGEELAKNDDFGGAIAMFRKAKEWNPKLDINPEVKAKSITLVAQGKKLAINGDKKGAVEKFIKAQQLDPHIDLYR